VEAAAESVAGRRSAWSRPVGVRVVARCGAAQKRKSGGWPVRRSEKAPWRSRSPLAVEVRRGGIQDGSPAVEEHRG
jgi:hypothetical protein